MGKGINISPTSTNGRQMKKILIITIIKGVEIKKTTM